ncbi:pleckstrin domain-containing protein [Heterostelium album PN500]|uniref:Pleckstrin domain-containing protein n=1 Tax=Heterostelium pallidum (strain ATCC 26659 / Pp 5 / PN500) TaxID=670386 RepID=D3B7C2_HETP5|nr:pleckstrin domain-containing protein [Heterostelium album PN500]EFA82665.1 pleckstrin domain-containing protein [Heterostelium album PN500]|eukprot:XP_020434782.1 pleckstrin domain-containing protein [Heterostelium album PN500]
MSEFADDKRKTAPPSSLLQHQQSSFGNSKQIGVAPLRTSHILKSPPLENGNSNGNHHPPMPKPRTFSVNVSASMNSSQNLEQQQQSHNHQPTPTPSPAPQQQQQQPPNVSPRNNQQQQPPNVSPRNNQQQQQQQQDGGNQAFVNGHALSPSLQASTPTPQQQQPLKSAIKSPPPKLAPRQPSSFNLSPNSSSSSLLGSGNSNLSEADSDTSSFMGDASSFMGEDVDQVVEDSDDDTDEEEEEMHENFLKELGLGNKNRDELKEQEKKEMELLAGGTKFRVTRCFVGLGSPLSTSPSQMMSSTPSQMRKSIYPTQQQQQQQQQQAASNGLQSNGSSSSTTTPNSNQPPQTLQNSNRKTVFNPRFSIYRPVAPRKPLPPPPPRKPVAKAYNDTQIKAAIKIQKCWRRYQQMLPFKKLKDVKLIFGGIDAIIAINTTLMSDIESILENWKPYSILGKSFTTLGVFLKAYTDYVKNFDFSLRRLQACSKEMKFVAFIKQAEDKTVPRSRLESLLITPVQRIPRYVLLLQDLLKHTEESHPDFPHITEGLEIIKKVAISINDTKRRADNSLKVIEVQNKLVGKFPNLVVADRRYVHEGYLLSGPSNVKTKKVYIFLFNDIIIFSRPSSNKIFSKSKFKFLKIEDLLPSPALTDIPNNPIMTHAFDIELRSVTCTFLAESEDSKQIWMSNFRKVFSDINSQQNNNQTLDKRAVEKAGQAKTYIENHFTNIMVKGRVTRGGTVRGQAPESADDYSADGSGGDLQGGGGAHGSSSGSGGGASGNDRQPMMVRQATFHNMTILQREERLKGMAEETSQLKMEHQKSEQQQTFNNNLNTINQSVQQQQQQQQQQQNDSNKYSSIKFGTVGRSTMITGAKKDNNNISGGGSSEDLNHHIDGTATLQPEKKRTGAPSLNKIFSTINLSSSSKDKDGSSTSKSKSTPSLSSINNNPAVKQSNLNLSALNSELKNRQNQNQS